MDQTQSTMDRLMPPTIVSFRSLVVALGVMLFCHSSVLAQPGRSTHSRPGVSLEVNTEVVKRLATVEDHVKERQWGQAILILEQVAAEHGNTMIALSPRRFLNVGVYCSSILANFPPEGLVVYREKHDAQAKQWLEQGLASRNPLMLEKIVRQAFVSSYGDEALYWLGEWAWDRGNFSAARDHWRQLLKLPNPPEAGEPQPVLRYPDSSFPQGEVVARIVLCHIMEGDRELARDWLGYLSKQHPEARGELAGRSGPLTEILSEVLKGSERWQFPIHAGDMPTFAGNPERNYRYPKAPDIGGAQWERPLPEHAYDAQSLQGEREPALAFHPIVVGNTIYFCDPERIYALDALTGEPRWPRALETLPPEAGPLDQAVIYESAIEALGGEKFRVGVPHFTLTVHEDRLYARMGSPVTGQLSTNVSTDAGSGKSELVCLDLAKEGKVEWVATPAILLAGEKPETWPLWAFEGAPVAHGGRVFVALRHSEAKAIVACLDAETGQPQWSRRVGSAVSGLGERQNFVSHLLVTSGENMVFYMPEFGVVTGLDAQDGRLVWAVTYPSFPPKDSRILDDPRKQGLTPCVFHRGVIYAAPTDSEFLLAISAKTGVLLWERQISIERDQIRHVLGVVNHRLILSGNHLWILNATTGAIESPRPLAPGREPEFDGYGRGILAGETLFWPSRATIEIRDLSGQRTKQPEPFPGGNLAIAGDLLLVAEARRIVAYANIARIKKKQQDLISQDPNAALPRLRLAQAEEASGQYLAALNLYEVALAKATPRDTIAGQPLKDVAREHRHKLLLRLGNQAMEEDLPRKATDYFQEALDGVANADAQAQALKLLGTAQAQANQTADAVGSFQRILEEGSLSEDSLRTFAKDQIASLIQKHGRGVYAKVEERAASELADRIKAKDLQGVENILRRFPNALIVSETKHQLAQLKKDRGDFWPAILSWRDIVEGPAQAPIRQAALYELAQALEEKHYLRPARKYWEQLRREFPSARIPTENGLSSAGPFITEHLKSQHYRRLDSSVPLLPFARRWELALEPKARVIVPQGEPPGPLLDCVLVDDRGLALVNVSQGQTLWRKPVNDPAIWAAYGPMPLVIGTKDSLFAVALETGETLWRTALGDPDEDDNASPRFELAGDQVLVLEQKAVSSYDANTGRLLWKTAASGRFRDLWHADEEFVIVQNESSLRVWVLETASGRRLSEHRPRGPWTSSPVPFRSPPPGSLKGTLATNRGFLAALENRSIHAFGAYDPQADPSWLYQGATSFANAPPWLCSQGGNLLMLMDGDTLISLEPDTGESRWFTFVSSSPLSSPGDCILLDKDRVYASGDQSFSCLDLKDGKALWKQPLPDASAWLVRKTGSVLVAMPSHSENQSQANLFEAHTGARIQTLNIPPNVTDVLFRPEGFLTIAQGKLTGFGPFEFSPAAN